MRTVGAFEAKTHLSSLLERVAKGERITITRHGVPTAMLVPVDSFGSPPQPGHREIVAGLRDLREKVKAGGISVREMVEEGRRW